ncbi:hypothetical protein PT974_01961 [Cladobotryum mycophilum]|uniref:Uncharacterized protein n=1 Tax=Cladobotryum mycophilum TaxID=491253 RepID=A0ABR0SX13_9HYPO
MHLPTTLLTLTTLSPSLSLALAQEVFIGQDAIYVGPKARNISSNVWDSIASNPNATSSTTFIGYDLSKPFPSSQQDGWTLSIATGGTCSPQSHTWHVCLYAFSVKPGSARADGWGTGENPSCEHLLPPECLDDLQNLGAQKFRGDACALFDPGPSCSKDLDQEIGMVLSVSAEDATSTFGNNTPFFKRVDGTYSNQTMIDIIPITAMGRPMAVLTLWGSSKNSRRRRNPFASVNCVMPDAEPFDADAESGASILSSSLGWSLVVLAAAFLV